MKNIRILSENFQFLKVKFSIYLNRRVFVIGSLNHSSILEIRLLLKPVEMGRLQPCKLHSCHMKGLNETDTPIFVLFCVICFQG